MSGICAVLGPDAEQLVEKMCRSLRHRGPSDEGFFIEDETVWITFDGEIYNAKPLREQLEKSHKFNTNSQRALELNGSPRSVGP